MNSGAATRRIALASLLARREGHLEARVEGRSMGATLPEGSLIRVRPGRDRDLAPGEVVAIAVNEKIVVHRVLSVVGSQATGSQPRSRGNKTSTASSSAPSGSLEVKKGGEGSGVSMHTPRGHPPIPSGGEPLVPRERREASELCPSSVRGRFPEGDPPRYDREVLLLTRGDAEILPDPPVPAAWLIGRVIEARTGEAAWQPVAPAPRRSLAGSILAGLTSESVAALMMLSPVLADRAARSMLFVAYVARFMMTGGREGRLVWPTRRSP